MPTGVKLTHAQTYRQFSCLETSLAPRQVHHKLNEIMYIIEGTITLLEGNDVREIAAGG